MKFFNKNYFTKWYNVDKQITMWWKIANSLRWYQERISKNISFFHPSLHIILNLPKNANVLDVWCWIWIRTYIKSSRFC